MLASVGFPLWLRTAHWLNVFFLGLLIRSGLQILAAYPRLYWNDHCQPGTEWLKPGARPIPAVGPWTGLDQEMAVSSWLAQPGGNNLGLGRHWHFVVALAWMATGLFYVAALLLSGEVGRLVPGSLEVFPDAWRCVVTYLHQGHPEYSSGGPYNALQQLTYAGVVFLLAPFLILTGAAQSPALGARYPGFVAMFGGRQGARSLHFLGLMAFVVFTVVHTAMVVYDGLGENLGKMLLGNTDHPEVAVATFVVLIALVLAFYAASSWYSRVQPRRVQAVTGYVLRPLLRRLELWAVSRQKLDAERVTRSLIVNGLPPAGERYRSLAAAGFEAWRLDVGGLVRRPECFSLQELKSLAVSSQKTRHHCIQGWSGIAQWAGVPFSEVCARCVPLPEARYVVFTSIESSSGGPYYECLDLAVLMKPQTLLAFEMNGGPLSLEHGAPLRLRMETELGFKMVKWLDRIEFVADYRDRGEGQGGTREDTLYYLTAAPI